MKRETQEWLDKLQEIFEYDQHTGKLTYKVRRGLKRRGEIYHGQAADPYRRVEVSGVRWMYHRVCWALYYGVWPTYTIDHINNNGSDNRIVNLRDVPQSVNNQNKPRYNTKNKYVGVYKGNGNNFYDAVFTSFGERFYLGYFKTQEEAAKARDAKAYEVRGDLAYLNFPEDYGLDPHPESHYKDEDDNEGSCDSNG